MTFDTDSRNVCLETSMTETSVACSTCNDKQSHWHMTTTSDRQPICMRCYRDATTEFKKGVIAHVEARATRVLYEEYDRAVLQLTLAMRRLAEYHNEAVERVHDRIANLENDLAVRKYLKARSCLTVTEHLAVIKEVLNTGSVKEAAMTSVHAQGGEASFRLVTEYHRKFGVAELPRVTEWRER